MTGRAPRVIALAELEPFTRRGFVRTALAGAGSALVLAGAGGALAMGACGGGGGGGGGTDDGGMGEGDLRSTPDLVTSSGACGFDTKMPPASFAAGTATFFADPSLFVCHDAGGYYALTSVCTHNGCDVNFISAASGFRCPCHQSRFSFNGAVTGGVAPSPLVHYALCLTQAGNLSVDGSGEVPAAKRFTF